MPAVLPLVCTLRLVRCPASYTNLYHQLCEAVQPAVPPAAALHIVTALPPELPERATLLPGADYADVPQAAAIAELCQAAQLA